MRISLTTFISAAIAIVFTACATTLTPRKGELVASVGPVDLPAAHGDHGHGDMTEKVARWRVAETGFITSLRPAMEDAEGNPLPGELLHHVAIGERSRADFLCTEHPHRMPHLILAAGGEMTQVDMPEGFGIHVERGTKLVAMGMFAPSARGSIENARFVARMDFSSARSGDALQPIVPVWIDVLASCPEDGYPIGQDGRDMKTREFSFPFAGELHLAGGHMHDGGRSLVITRVSDGRVLASFEPKYDGDRIAAIPLVHFTPAVRVEPGERYRLQAIYAARPSHGGRAMGIVVAFVAPDAAP